MGFFIVRVMKEFSMSLREVLDLPARHFIWLSDQIDRVRAELDLRQLRVVVSAGSPEGYETTHGHLQKELGELFKYGRYIIKTPVIDEDDGELDPEFDRAGLHALKMRHQGA